MRWIALGALLAACDPVAKDCEELCRELTIRCDYAAFPSLDSCRQGCAYSAGQGADVAVARECFEAADCNTFEIVECQHDLDIP